MGLRQLPRERIPPMSNKVSTINGESVEQFNAYSDLIEVYTALRIIGGTMKNVGGDESTRSDEFDVYELALYVGGRLIELSKKLEGCADHLGPAGVIRDYKKSLEEAEGVSA